MERAAACQRWLQRAFVLLFDYIRMWGLLHFNPRGVDASTPGPRYVMVANHPTLVDIGALSAVFGRIVCVAKPLLFRAPFLGQVLGACVYVEGGEMEGLAVAAFFTRALDRLARSMPMLASEGRGLPAACGSGAGRSRSLAGRMFPVPVLIRCEPGARKGDSVVRYCTANGIFAVTRSRARPPSGASDLVDRSVRGNLPPSPGPGRFRDTHN
jgi:hypothetical protein